MAYLMISSHHCDVPALYVPEITFFSIHYTSVQTIVSLNSIQLVTRGLYNLLLFLLPSPVIGISDGNHFLTV